MQLVSKPLKKRGVKTFSSFVLKSATKSPIHKKALNRRLSAAIEISNVNVVDEKEKEQEQQISNLANLLKTVPFFKQ